MGSTNIVWTGDVNGTPPVTGPSASLNTTTPGPKTVTATITYSFTCPVGGVTPPAPVVDTGVGSYTVHQVTLGAVAHIPLNSSDANDKTKTLAVTIAPSTTATLTLRIKTGSGGNATLTPSSVTGTGGTVNVTGTAQSTGENDVTIEAVHNNHVCAETSFTVYEVVFTLDTWTQSLTPTTTGAAAYDWQTADGEILASAVVSTAFGGSSAILDGKLEALVKTKSDPAITGLDIKVNVKAALSFVIRRQLVTNPDSGHGSGAGIDHYGRVIRYDGTTQSAFNLSDSVTNDPGPASCQPNPQLPCPQGSYTCPGTVTPITKNSGQKTLQTKSTTPSKIRLVSNMDVRVCDKGNSHIEAHVQDFTLDIDAATIDVVP